MTNSLAIGNLGNYYNDPYFWQAYNYQPQFTSTGVNGVNPYGVNGVNSYGVNPAYAAQVTPQAAGSYTDVSVPTGYENILTEQQDAKAKGKEKSRAGLLLSSVALLIAGIVCHKKGSADKNLIPRIIDGGKYYWGKVSEACKKGIGNAKSVVKKSTKTKAEATAANVTKTAEKAAAETKIPEQLSLYNEKGFWTNPEA